MCKARTREEMEVDLVKQAISHLLDADLVPENGWSNEEIEILKSLENEDFTILRKQDEKAL